ncbi:hypothetical protein [uncultured Paludibaculum sp.]|uniref:hypothetical protein n=1 Tax=uncultured Paludibaculum sp. TaxID=1765020 RepID=UPI002AAB0DDE|nr:hypothetical protein [uncultured Paludibaculum sp.]
MVSAWKAGVGLDASTWSPVFADGLGSAAAAMMAAPTILMRFLPGLGAAQGQLRTVVPGFYDAKKEGLALGPILRFTFRAMPDKNVLYDEAEACRLRHDLLGPLNIASGFLELLSSELGAGSSSVAAEYLSRARDGVARAIQLAIKIGTVPDGQIGGDPVSTLENTATNKDRSPGDGAD